jgi:hypothetical protein
MRTSTKGAVVLLLGLGACEATPAATTSSTAVSPPEAQQLVNDAWQAYRTGQCDLMASKIRSFMKYAALNQPGPNSDAGYALMDAQLNCTAVAGTLQAGRESADRQRVAAQNSPAPTASPTQNLYVPQVAANRSAPSATIGSISTEVLQSYANAVVAAVEQDSHAWITETYDRGSLTGYEFDNPRAYPYTNLFAPYAHLRANYTFNGGRKGFVIANFNGLHLYCMSYSEDPFGGYPGFPAPDRMGALPCHAPLTAEYASRAAVLRREREAEIQKGAERLRAYIQDPKNYGPSGRSPPGVTVPGPSISTCNRLTTGNWMSGALGNPLCD